MFARRAAHCIDQAQFFQLCQSEGRHLAGAVSGSIHGGVVNQHKVSVAARANVQLHHVYTQRDGVLNGRQRIFRQNNLPVFHKRRAMGDDENIRARRVLPAVQNVLERTRQRLAGQQQ